MALDAQKAHIAHKALRKAGESLRKNFADDKYWVDLARDHDLILPRWYLPADSKYYARWFKKLKMSRKEYFELTGYTDLGEFQKLNPAWPLRAWVGLLLEYVLERDAARDRFHGMIGHENRHENNE